MVPSVQRHFVSNYQTNGLRIFEINKIIIHTAYQKEWITTAATTLHGRSESLFQRNYSTVNCAHDAIHVCTQTNIHAFLPKYTYVLSQLTVFVNQCQILGKEICTVGPAIYLMDQFASYRLSRQEISRRKNDKYFIGIGINSEVRIKIGATQNSFTFKLVN